VTNWLPVLGQGACFLGERSETAHMEKAALLRGLSLGMNLFDTAESYGGGGSERLIGDMLRARLFKRDDVVIMTKLSPGNASPPALYESCDNSLRRLGADYIDVYLLHWREAATDLAGAARGMEELARRGKILRWGVSNFDVGDMEELFATPDGANCRVNQALYHIGSRGAEYDLLPWLREHGVAPVAYCPLAQGGTQRRTAQDFLTSPALRSVAKKYAASVFQVMLAFVIRSGDICAVPKSSSVAHVEENAAARELARLITASDWLELDGAYPPPTYKMHLDMD